MTAFGLYIHIPFCALRCPYCDFNTYVVPRPPERRYTDALCREIAHRLSLPAWRGRPVRSIYFGGGTPSLFRPASIERVVAAIRSRAAIVPEVEVTVEANPGSGVESAFDELRAAGVNRLSFGAQSFSARHLKMLGRIHSAEDTIRAYERARAAGFSNINLDLIYALPEQSMAELESDLDAVTALRPEHVSAYTLTIEKGTPFFTTFERGDLQLPSDDCAVEMMGLVRTTLGARSLPQYEISNFASPARRSIHNSAYWRGEDYLGVGAGAHSYAAAEGGAFGRRWSNYALPGRYIERISRAGTAEGWQDVLGREGALFEFFFLGLRRTEGVEVRSFEQKFGAPLETVFGAEVRELSEAGLLRLESGMLRLTEGGQNLMDTVLEYFAAPTVSSPGADATEPALSHPL